MEDDFLLSRETCNKIESILASRYPNCRFRIGYSFLRDQQEISIATFNADTNTVFGNDFGLRSSLEKAENQQDFIDMLLEHASLQAESIIKQSQQIQPKETNHDTVATY